MRSLFIDGRWIPSTATTWIDVVDPATAQVVDAIPVATSTDVDAAVSSAGKAAPGWARTPVSARAGALKAAARAVRSNASELARMQTQDNGKPAAMSAGDVEAAAATLEQFAELGQLHRGRSLVGEWAAADTMVHGPYGVAALLVPWNDPVAIAAQMLAACLVAGNTVVLKPSERTPLATIRLVELFDLPPGVVNLLLGDGRTGEALVSAAGVDLVLHTGSIATGRAIAERCGRNLKKAVLELGGKDPLIVEAGVDPGWAAEQAAAGAFANAGQICTAVERVYVHADVAEEFLAALVDRAEAQELGPLIDERQRQLVHRHVAEAVADGAQVLTGGRLPDGPGFFYPATVLRDVTDDMAVMREETFGPVAPVRVVTSFDEALEAANATEYGLAASVLTPSQDHAQRAWRELAAGTVKINAVWGGAPGGAAHPHGSSGLGYGYGPELLDEVTLTRVVHYRPAVAR